MPFTKENARAYASRGGKAVVAKYGPDHMRELARKNIEKHGVEGLRRAGKKGFEVTCQRHWKGDKRKMLARNGYISVHKQDPYKDLNNAFHRDPQPGDPW